MVCGGKSELLLWRSVFCGVSDEAYRDTGGTDVSFDAHASGRICFCTSIYAGEADDSGLQEREKCQRCSSTWGASGRCRCIIGRKHALCGDWKSSALDTGNL